MKILPASIEQQINRIDRTRSLIAGISFGLLAFWSFYRVLWMLYLTIAYNFLFGSLMFSIVLWAVIGAVATIAAVAFLTRYVRPPKSAEHDELTQP